MPNDYYDDHWKYHGYPIMVIQDVLWYGGPGALEWHTPSSSVDKHWLTKCGYKFAYGLESKPGAEKYPNCIKCHE